MKVVHYFRLIFLLLFIGAIGCKTNKPLPCVPIKVVIDSIVYKRDTIKIWQPLSEVPILKITCFEHIGKDSIQIFSFPCNSINEQQIIYRTRTELDTVYNLYLQGEVSRLQKDSLKTAQTLFELKNSTDKKAYFYKTAFFISLGLIVLLAAFLIWRLTRRATNTL